MASREEWASALSEPTPPPVPGGRKDPKLEAARHAHADYIVKQLSEMRRCLKLSEEARDKYYKAVDYWEDKGFAGTELDIELKNDYKAQKNVSDNQLYDRWAMKYAAVVSAEIAAFEHDLHPRE